MPAAAATAMESTSALRLLNISVTLSSL
jgi:hypothetical protein